MDILRGNPFDIVQIYCPLDVCRQRSIACGDRYETQSEEQLVWMEKNMQIRLREMSEKEFKVFFEYSVNDYANDLVKSANITMGEALMQAKGEFAEMLPNGVSSKDNALRIIVDAVEEKVVGVIWYLFEMTDGIKQVFLSDFIIKEEERRKGYASVALTEMEQDAKKNGCTESIIYVWKHNLPGINLYTKCGYGVFKELDDGMYMKKGIKE